MFMWVEVYVGQKSLFSKENKQTGEAHKLVFAHFRWRHGRKNVYVGRKHNNVYVGQNQNPGKISRPNWGHQAVRFSSAPSLVNPSLQHCSMGSLGISYRIHDCIEFIKLFDLHSDNPPSSIFPTTFELGVTFSPAPECVAVHCWNRVAPIPPAPCHQVAVDPFVPTWTKNYTVNTFLEGADHYTKIFWAMFNAFEIVDK